MNNRNKPTIVHPVRLQPGKEMIFKDKIIFERQTSQLKGLYNLAILEIPRPCSDQWRKYYFGVVVGDTMKDTSPTNFFGVTQKYLHKFYKDTFNYGESTTILDNIGWKDFTEKIQLWISIKYKFKIPDPNQVDFL